MNTRVIPYFSRFPFVVLAVFLFTAGLMYSLLSIDPSDRRTREMLLKRAEVQRKSLRSSKTNVAFHFTDTSETSGITFHQQPVEDGGKNYKFIDYDHGNGLAAADIDGDGLIDLYFVNQRGGNKLYKNLGHGQFLDITAQAGVSMEQTINVSASFADINNDGLPDLYVTTIRGGNALFKNIGNGKFEEITLRSGTAYTGHSSSALFFDYNNDGFLDLLLLNVAGFTTDTIGNGGYYIGKTQWDSPRINEQVKLFKNLKNDSFADVTESLGLDRDLGWTNDAIFLPNQSTGLPDLLILNMIGKSHFFQNQNGTKFLDKTDEFFPVLPHGAMGIAMANLSHTENQDLFLTNMHDDMILKAGMTDTDVQNEKLKIYRASPHIQSASRMNGFVRGNAFLRKKSDGIYEEISEKVNAETFWPWGTSVGDINADGYDDLFITAGMGYPYRYGINSLLVNDQGEKFLDSEFLVGIEPRKNMKYDIPWFTLHCSDEDSARMECQGKTGDNTIRGSLSSRSSVIFDIDNDGDLDIVTNEWGSNPQVLINTLAQEKNISFLKVKLIGHTTNRDGLGARVRVNTGNEHQVSVLTGKSGYLSQSQIPLYFGLGDNKTVDSLEISWPSGMTQKISGSIDTHTTIEINEK